MTFSVWPALEAILEPLGQELLEVPAGPFCDAVDAAAGLVHYRVADGAGRRVEGLGHPGRPAEAAFGECQTRVVDQQYGAATRAITRAAHERRREHAFQVQAHAGVRQARIRRGRGIGERGKQGFERGFVDAIVYPEDTREVLTLALRAARSNRGPHLGPFVLPPIPDA